MRTVLASTLPQKLVDYIVNPDPLEGEDVAILDDKGDIIAVVVQPAAYRFFLSVVEEREDGQDSSVEAPFDPNARSLDDLIAEAKNEKS